MVRIKGTRTRLVACVAICAYAAGIWHKEFTAMVATIGRAETGLEDASYDSLCARVGVLLGLKSALRSEVDLIDRLEKGLPASTVESLRARVGLTDEEVFQLIAPRRTLSRRAASGQSLSREEADKTVRVARVSARAQQVFGGRPQYAADWLRAANFELGERTPMQALAIESGALAVEELLVGIGHGMFA